MTAAAPRVFAARPALDADLRAEMQRGHLPGLAVGIIAHGELAWAAGYGLADVEHRVPATPDTLFNLASMSKTVTAVAVMQQYEAGRFRLDDDVGDGRYLPFPVRNPRFPRAPITFRQLMTHTSSILDGAAVDDLVAVGDPTISLEDFFRGYLVPGGSYYSRNGNFADTPPGRAGSYSNAGAALLGYLTERLSGVPFDRYCRERIFAPLGMTATTWRLAEVDPARRAVGYQWMHGAFEPQPVYGWPSYPDGALRSSVRELSRFVIAFAQGGQYHGVRILQPATVAEMSRAQVPDDGSGSAQGLIWFAWRFDDEPLLGHDGDYAGFRGMFSIRPRDGAGVIVLTNAAESEEGDLAALNARLYGEVPAL